jgi:P-type Mg2+ transporter
MNEVTAHTGPKHSADGLKAMSTSAVREASNDLEVTVANVRGSLDGLVESDAVERLEEVGPNEIAREKPPHWLLQLLACFKNPFIIVLVVLAIIQYVTNPDDLRPVIIVSVMVAISVGLQFWQEYRSALAAEKLKALVRTTATVLRRPSPDAPAEPREIPIAELVPGDVVLLSAGDLVPADVRLISSRDLFVSQSALTGEALPVEKHDTLGAVVEKSASGRVEDSGGLLDRSNICFLGTNVVSGTATAIVVATGPRTYFGSLAKSIIGRRAQTSFERGVNSVSWVLIRFTGGLRHQWLHQR